ncbi:Os01g0844000 [Oryza sativa Japonica Group]|uniref:Os01g0844000 protein n=1 Tax=Oryza sativa subsp. japonica TaxID=39947 RepID=A0A0P0VAD8_ORYSJ|nr:Os01g0844000 [Oryza sativa Japonica Group]
MTSATVYICLLSQRDPHEEIRPAGSLFSTSLSLPLLLSISPLFLCAVARGGAAAPSQRGRRRRPGRQIRQGREGRRGGAEPARAAAAARPPDPAGAGGEARRRSGRQIRQGRGEARWRTTDLEPWRGGGRRWEGRRPRPDGGSGLHLRRLYR